MAHENHLPKGPEKSSRPPVDAVLVHQTWQPRPVPGGGEAEPRSREYDASELTLGGQLGTHATRKALAADQTAEVAWAQPQANAVPTTGLPAGRREVASKPSSHDLDRTVAAGEVTVAGVQAVVTQARRANQPAAKPDKLAISNGAGQLQHVVGGEVTPVLDPDGQVIELATADAVTRQGEWTFVDGEMLLRVGVDGQKLALSAGLEWVPAPGWFERRKIQNAAAKGSLRTPVFTPGRAPAPIELPPHEAPALVLPERSLMAVGKPPAGDVTEEFTRPATAVSTTTDRLEHTAVEPSFEDTQVAAENAGDDAVTFSRLSELLGEEVPREHAARRKLPSENTLAKETYGRPMRGLTPAEQAQVHMRLGRLRRGLDAA